MGWFIALFSLWKYGWLSVSEIISASRIARWTFCCFKKSRFSLSNWISAVQSNTSSVIFRKDDIFREPYGFKHCKTGIQLFYNLEFGLPRFSSFVLTSLEKWEHALYETFPNTHKLGGCTCLRIVETNFKLFWKSFNMPKKLNQTLFLNRRPISVVFVHDFAKMCPLRKLFC